MAKDQTYKKTYKGEYLKSYKDARLQRKINEQQYKDYQRASKKINDVPYINPTAPEKTGHVNPAGIGGKTGSVNTAETATPPVYTASKPRATVGANTQKATSVDNNISNPTKPARNKNDFSYIDKSSLQPPIKVLGANEYKDIYTSEVIDRTGAYKRLNYAGYYPKPPMEKNTFVMTCFLALLFPFIGPFFLYSIGSGMKKQEMSTLIKDVGHQRLTFSMPISETDKNEGMQRGNICSTLAIVFGIIHFYFIFYR